MRIGIDTHFVTSAAATGNRTYTVGLVQALLGADRQHEYVLYAIEDHPFYRQYAGNPRVTTRAVLARNGPVRNFVSLPRAAARDQLDVLHLQFVCPWLPRARTVLAIHDLYYYHMPRPTLYERALRLLTRWSAQRADYIVTLSQYSAQDISRICRIGPERIVVIPLAADTRFKPAAEPLAVGQLRQRLGLGPEYFLFVGRTEDPRKNLPVLLEAFLAFRQRTGSNQQLVIVGRQQAGTAGLLARIEAAGLQEAVCLPGIISADDLPLLMAGATLFVYVSSFEGFGLPVLEAMACGTPVITSNTTSLPEVAGDAALLVSPGQVEELTQALVRLARDAELREDLRARGLQRAGLFSWDRTARETLALYARAVNSQPARSRA